MSNSLYLLRSAFAAVCDELELLRWKPLTDSQPSEEDGSDVEYSDGRDIWQARWNDTEKATHWRRITLP